MNIPIFWVMTPHSLVAMNIPVFWVMTPHSLVAMNIPVFWVVTPHSLVAMNIPVFTLGPRGISWRTLAKEAATNMDQAENYKKIPKSIVMSELTEMSIQTWQRQWDQTTKGAITKEYFPVVNERLKMNIKCTPNLTTLITAHGNIRSYRHRFKLIT